MSAQSGLELRGVTVRYGALRAIDDITVELEGSGVTSLVGPNGAGKSTLLDVASGFRRPAEGSVHWEGEELHGRPHVYSRLGIRRTFQTPRMMGHATLIDNVLVGAVHDVRSSFLAQVLDTRRHHATELELRSRALAALEQVDLAQRADDLAANLSYGQARLLELARALAGRPRMLLLDEPAAGLNDDETSALGRLLRRLAAGGTAIVLVEHNLGLVTTISDTIHVMNFGQLIASGDAESVVRDPVVVEAYTGSTE